jgi:DNA polymerase-4
MAFPTEVLAGLGLNRNAPALMHVDLNACFASVEQQANPLLRGRPVAVAAYASPGGCIVSPSVEAKRFGVKVGMTVREGRLLCPGLVVLPPDPPKYRAAHLSLRRIFRDYSPDVEPKSIDEAVIDFAGTPALKRGLVEVAREIKGRVKEDVGCWMRCSVGIGTNRFLAKLAAGLQKPNGLVTLDHANLEAAYAKLSLTDLPGINVRFEARLNAAGIHTPPEFLAASPATLRQRVFRSIAGQQWSLRLRGWEADAVVFARRTYGQNYSIGGGCGDPHELSALLMKMAEKAGRRMRRDGWACRGVHVACVFADGTHWHVGRVRDEPLYATQDVHRRAMLLFNRRPGKRVAKLSVTCYELVKTHREQLALFETRADTMARLADAADAVNDRYGEFLLTPALMLGLEEKVIDRVSFGGVRELEDACGGEPEPPDPRRDY